MPDIGLIELLVIGLLLFLVVGPERMPEALKQVTHVVRTVRGWMGNVMTALTEQTETLKTPLEQSKAAVQQDLNIDASPVGHELGEALQEFKEAMEEKTPVATQQPTANTSATKND